MPYETVFDVTQKPFEWWWSAIGLVFVLAGIAFIKFAPKLERDAATNQPRLYLGIKSKHFGWLLVFVGSSFTILLFGFMYSDYYECIDAFQKGHYAIVEGTVQDFRPMPYEGHRNECFRVDREEFCYSDYEVSPAFNQSASHGGPIRSGLPVRISYYVGDGLQRRILKLEIRGDSLPTGTERVSYQRAEEGKWRDWVKNNPTFDNFQLGLSFAAVLIVLSWNIGWKHFARYWAWKAPPYTRATELTFRGFFLLGLVGTCFQFVRVVSGRPRSVAAYGKAAMWSFICVAFFALADLVSRKRLRGRSQPFASR